MRGELGESQKPRMLVGERPPLEAYDVDIIILSLNRFSETCEAVDSALSQRGTTAHLTLVDQGSDPAMVQNLRQKYRSAANFSFYSNAQNLGVAGPQSGIFAWSWAIHCGTR
jgi:GT2 family glycosyltransferase